MSLPKEITLGVMGGGQLGRMFVHAAQQMGYFTAVLDPDPLSPAGRVSHHHIQTAYTDAAGLAQLAAVSVAITTEFENVPAQALAQLAATRQSVLGCTPINLVPVVEARFLYEAGQAPGSCPHADQKADLSQQNCAANGQALTYQSRGHRQPTKCFDHSSLKSERLRV